MTDPLAAICEAAGLPKGTKAEDIARHVRETIATVETLREQLNRALGENLQLRRPTRLDAVARQGCHGDVAR